jgi:hypothetical protein
LIAEVMGRADAAERALSVLSTVVRAGFGAAAAHQDVAAIARPRKGLTALAGREQRFRLSAAHGLPRRPAATEPP